MTYHALAAAHRGSLPAKAGGDWKPVSLDQASRWLRCDPDDAGRKGRIRYATQKLAAAIVILHQPHSGAQKTSVAPFITSLETLLGAKTTLVEQLAESGLTDFSALRDKAGAIIDAATDEPSLMALQRTCCGCIDQCAVGPSMNETLAEFQIKVNRSPSCVFHAVDPQCWPHVTSGYFNDVFVLDAAPCNGATPVCRTSDICITQATAKTSTPPTPGQPWCGLVYEDLTADTAGTSVSFENVLKANVGYLPAGATPDTATGLRLDYGMCESVKWEMCVPGCQSGSCLIDRDCGHAEVYDPGPGNAVIDGSKHIHFKSFASDDPAAPPLDGNLWAPLVFEVMVEESAIAACSPASVCPRAAAPANCTEFPGPDNCECDRDHCQQMDSVPQAKPTVLCP
ncbi:MAG: hypothetical protein U0802_00760 [Candidatus Binatia bacterium]